MKTICLNMIVKNESHVIKRCLESVKFFIDYWVIFDTGSTDGTQTLIREELKEIPGELYERPWLNFAHNRNEALQAALGKADYIFFIDADEYLAVTKPFHPSEWNKDFYMIKAKTENSSFFHPNIVRNDPEWKWEGVIHECINHPRKMDGEILPNVHMNRPQDGARSRDPNTYVKDIAILQEAAKKEPWNARHMFYLAQTYSALQDTPSALKYYQKRVLMDGDQDELFWSLFRIGYLQETQGADPQTVIASYCRAHQQKPHRAEPLERLANYYNTHKCPSLAYIIAKFGVCIRMPEALNCDFYPWVYEYGLLIQLADAALALGFAKEAVNYYQELLTKPTLIEHLKPSIHRQLAIVQRKQRLQETEDFL